MSGNLTFEDGEDFFAYISEDKGGASAVAMMVVCGFGDLVSLPLLLGALSYKLSGSLNYQTLIDKIYSFILVDMLFFIATSLNVYNLRVFTALPHGLCLLLTTHGAAAGFVGILCVNEIMILRYLYTCVWKHIGFLNDEVFGRFFAIFNVLFGLMYAGLFIFSQGYLNLTMAMCEGVNPTVYSTKFYSAMEAQGKMPLLPIINALNSLTCLALYLTIHFKTRQLHQGNAFSQNQITKTFGFSKLSTVLALISSILCSMPYAIVRRIINDGNIDQIPKFLLTLTNVMPMIPILVVLPALLYFNDSSLRAHVAREFKDSCIWHVLAKCLHRNP